MISSCGEGSDPARAFDVSEVMLRQAMKPNMFSYSALFLVVTCVYMLVRGSPPAMPGDTFST